MASPISADRGQRSEGAAPTREAPTRVTPDDKKDIRVAADDVKDHQVKAEAQRFGGGDGFTKSASTGRRSGVPEGHAAAVGAGPAYEAVAGARIDARPARLPGPTPGAQVPSGPPETVYHFTSREASRGMLRNGVRAGQNGLAYFTGKDSPTKAGSQVAKSPVKLDVEIRTRPGVTLARKGPGGYSTLGNEAAAQLKLQDPSFNRNTPAGQARVDGIRNQALGRSIRGNNAVHTAVKVGEGQTFHVLKPDGLVNAQVTKLTQRGLGRFGAARASGLQLSKEIMSGHAQGAVRTAKAVGATSGQVAIASRAATASKVLGRVAVPLGVALDGYAIATSDDKVRTGVAKGTAWTGAFAGAKGGAALGATIGAVGGPVGAAVGGVIGGLAGGVGGYFGGEFAGGKVVDAVRGWFG